MEKKYQNFLLPTSQFVMCGNCFRMDTYKSCSFGCRYCFASNRGGNLDFGDFQVADMKYAKYLFESAIDKGDVSTIKKECLNHYVPIHLGGMSDPFQPAEWVHGATYDFLQLTNKYHYPVNISTKTAHLPDKYWDVLNPDIHTFSISLMGYTESYVRTWEANTPAPAERIEFIKELKKRGFWVSIRIQPIIDIKEALLLIEKTEDFVDYYTVEHLKLPFDNSKKFKMLCSKLNLAIPVVARGREYEFDANVKLKNIELIKKHTKVKIGCGDNNLHTMSDSLNCCGIDLMPPAFSNWLKYNSMYIKMTGDRTQWRPQNSCTQCLNGDCVIKGMTKVEDYVERYYTKTYGDESQLELF